MLTRGSLRALAGTVSESVSESTQILMANFFLFVSVCNFFF